MNAKLFSKDEVNTGRQREFDYLKGAGMVLIFLIHAYQGTSSDEDVVVNAVYSFNSMSGAALFIFMLGFGTAYARRTAPGDFMRNGAKLILFQYLNNLFTAAALVLPYPLVAKTVSDGVREMLPMGVMLFLQYTNIFFISGIIYFVLALLKKLNARTPVYVLLGVGISILAPILCGKPVNIPVIGYIVQLLIGEADHVSFTPLYFLPYALIGAAFGKLFRRIGEKRQFYRIAVPVCLVIAAAWWALVFVRYGTDMDALRTNLGYAYIHPDLWHMIASVAHILLMAGAVWLLAGEKCAREPANPVSRQLLYYSKHISKYYAIHLPVYILFLGLHGYRGFTPAQCWGLTLLCMAITEAIVRGYNCVYNKIKQRKTA